MGQGMWAKGWKDRSSESKVVTLRISQVEKVKLQEMTQSRL